MDSFEPTYRRSVGLTRALVPRPSSIHSFVFRVVDNTAPSPTQPHHAAVCKDHGRNINTTIAIRHIVPSVYLELSVPHNSKMPSTTNQDQNSVYQDLIGFLESQRQDLRLEATKAVLQVVNDRNEVLQLLEHGVLKPLLRIVSDTSDTACSENALKALLYLSSSVEEATNRCVEELLDAKAVPRLIELVLGSGDSRSSSTTTPQQLNSALAILANLTRTERGAVELVGKTLPEHAVSVNDVSGREELAEREKSRPTLELLLDRYLNRELVVGQPNYAEKEPHEWDMLADDPYQHFSAVLMNATQLESGKKFVLRIPQASAKNASPPPSIFQRLLPQLQTPNPIRRRGISGMVRNCCLEKESAWWMLNVANLLTPLLYPLAGPEELDLDEKQGMDPDLWLQGPDKEREPDEATRQHLVDALLLLCATGRKSRESLRLGRTYIILKYADMVEESEEVSERINECVQYLRRDEEGTEEGSSDRMVEEATRNRLKLLPSAQVGLAGTADYDDVD